MSLPEKSSSCCSSGSEDGGCPSMFELVDAQGNLCLSESESLLPVIFAIREEIFADKIGGAHKP